MNVFKNKRIAIFQNSDAKALVSNFTWLAILKIFSYIFPLITLPYLSRVIGVDNFGEIAFATSIMIFIETFVDFGFNYTATRNLARERTDLVIVSKIFSNVLWAKILLMTIGFIILLVLIYTIPSLYEKRLLLLLTFLYIPGHIIFPDWFFQAMEKMKYITIMNVLSKLLFTILIFVVIREKNDYVWQPLLSAIGYWVGGIISMWFIIKKFHVRIFLPKLNEILLSIKESSNMFFSLLFPNLYTNFSTILLRSTSGDVATGLFDAGKKFITIIDQLFQVLSRTFYPFLSRKINKHNLYAKISGILSLLLSLVLFLSAEILVKIFYTEEFISAVDVIKIMSISPFSLFLINTYGVNYLVLVGKEKLYRNIILIYSVLGFVITWYLTTQYSYIGTAVTISGIWLLRGLTTFLYAQKHKCSVNKS